MEWGEFRLGDLFDKLNLKFTKTIFDKEKDISKIKTLEFDLPLVNAKDGDNGVMYFGRSQDFESAEMTIDIVNDGAISTGNVYSQPKRTGVLYNAYLIKPNFEVSERLLHFFTTSILKSIKLKFGYENKAGWAKVSKEKIQLPIKNGEIDFDFMEEFITELEADRITELEAYLQTTGLDDYTLSSEETKAVELLEQDKLEWGEFRLGDLFEVATGRDVIIGKVQNGNIPLVSHQHENNGITKNITQLSDRRMFNFKNSLPLADRGVFLATNQNQDFHIGTRVKALTFKDGEKNEKNRLFFVTAINQLQILFTDYSNNATNNLPNLKIQLPIKNGEIDFDFMETLISAIQKLVIKDVVLYADRKIAATKQVVKNN